MGALTAVVAILALVDGICHLAIDAMAQKVFATGKWNTFSYLFLLQFLGSVALVVALYASERASLGQRRIVGALLAIYPAVTLIAWLYLTKAKGNPMNLATIDKPVEVVLVIVAAYRVFQLGQGAAAKTIVSPARG
jgi:uncharacterized membrane protein HdeD (DUF308 family)